MRARALFSLVGALIVAISLASASGAATAKAQKTTKIDVSTRAAVVHYLRSIHVNAKGAVIQRGALNYAGARCPGEGWTCASTKHTVVQIAKQGGQNRFACRSAHCVVVQISGVSRGVYIAGRQLASAAAAPKGGSNATCVKTGSGATTGTGQSCVISQVGSGPNTAGVYENTQKVSGLVQSAQYTASITQQSTGSNNNTACVTQVISLDGSATNTNGKQTTADLQAHQSILISQNNSGTGTGTNAATNSARYAATSTGACDTSSQMTQSQTLTSTVTATGPITQNEDTKYLPCGDKLPGDYANLCLKIDQNQSFQCTSSTSCPSTTNNFAIFTQNSSQTAVANSTKSAAVAQTQSAPPCSSGPPVVGPTDCVAGSGLVGTINQDGSGVSTATPTQNEVQCVDAAISGLTSCSHTADTSTLPSSKLTQNQYGPVGVGNLSSHRHGRVLFVHLKGLGQAHQAGNVGDVYTITQNSTQYADVGAFQQNFGNADCATDGFCTATQTTTTNGGTTQDGYTAPSISGLAITCPTGSTCTGTPPPAPTSVSGPTSPNPSSSAAFTWNEAATGGVSFLCKIDDGTPQTCSSGTPFFQGYGAHTFQVQATDNFTNGSAFVPSTPISFTNVPPDPTITFGPDQPDSTSRDASFTFHDPDSTIQNFFCKLDSALSYTACPSSTPMYSGLSLGPHTLDVKAASDSTGQYQSIGNAEYAWTVIPYLTFEASSDGASGWSNGAKSPIDLTTGADIPNTFAQVTLHNFEGIALSDLVGAGGPTFTTDNYAAGSPRYVIDLDNGHSLWGYPSNSGLNGPDFAWAIDNGNTYESWSDALSAEPGAKVADVVVVADGDQPSTTDVITDLTFDGYNFNPSS